MAKITLDISTDTIAIIAVKDDGSIAEVYKSSGDPSTEKGRYPDNPVSNTTVTLQRSIDIMKATGADGKTAASYYHDWACNWWCV